MKEKPTALIIDALTGEEVIEELTEEEVTQREEAFLLAETDRQAKEQAKNSALAKLAALGLTEEEIAAL